MRLLSAVRVRLNLLISKIEQGSSQDLPAGVTSDARRRNLDVSVPVHDLVGFLQHAGAFPGAAVPKPAPLLEGAGEIVAVAGLAEERGRLQQAAPGFARVVLGGVNSGLHT